MVVLVLKWLGDPKNHTKIKNTLIKLHKIFSAIAKFVSSQVVGMVDDLYNLLSDETDPWTKIKSFVSIWLKFAGAFLAIRYLTQPWKIIGDFMRKFGSYLIGEVEEPNQMLLKRKGRLLMTGSGVKNNKMVPWWIYWCYCIMGSNGIFIPT